MNGIIDEFNVLGEMIKDGVFDLDDTWCDLNGDFILVENVGFEFVEASDDFAGT